MSTTGENHPLLPDTFSIAPLETWADAIQLLSFEAERCFLQKVEHYKALSDMEHEFLVVYASHPSGSQIVLGVDRNGPLSSLVCSKSLPSSSSSSSSPPSSSSSSGRDLAYDGVQVSHDGTIVPILAHQNAPSVPLYTITFSSPSPSRSSSNSDASCPSLLHLSVLLVTIRRRFPCYTLFQYQCYFFARVTCLALVDLFGSVEMEVKEGERVGTWRGMHVSALRDMLPLAALPASATLTTPGVQSDMVERLTHDQGLAAMRR